LDGVAGPTPIGVAKPYVFRDNWQTLIELGWSPVGIYPADEKNKAKAKLPIGYGWQQRSEVLIGMDNLPPAGCQGRGSFGQSGQAKNGPGRGRHSQVPATRRQWCLRRLQEVLRNRLDMLDVALQRAVIACFPQCPIRIGNPKKAGCLLLRWGGPGPAPSKRYLGKDKDEMLVEMIGVGRQTVMPPSMHPCGQPYHMADGGPVPCVEDLPEFDQSHIDAMEKVLANYLGTHHAGTSRQLPGSPPGRTAANPRPSSGRRREFVFVSTIGLSRQ
jgi:hypothetical protein